ncbi:DUF4374 domain-containing protein [Marinilongibacter aquaticus]|uniref:DUF4374 domain-containing protein n=1 Tax=Marinilongibacter aquaticus TaxID=2975157 RepID=UPI0021BDCC60|nr:DUF4374 domain-containing protein [Marinilongibacter aquaticus]UBM58636.1 DUF4374 domain-containing protein [Marinilongibacter aquaticus]
MSFKKQWFNAFLACVFFSLLSCTDDENKDTVDPDPDPVATVESKYVVAATSGENDYLVMGDELKAEYTFDATSTDAVQSPGDRTWTFYGDEVVYGFLYNQADAGTTASYVLNADGELSKRNELALDVSIQTRGVVNDQLVLAYSDRLRDTTVEQKAYFYTVDPSTDASKLYTVVSSDLLEEGEAAYFTDITEYEGLLVAGARSISSSSFSSDYYHNTYLVVFNPDFTVKEVIKDEGRTGFVAGQKYSQGETGLEVVENGDLYVFSSGQTNYADANTENIPSGVLKINKGDFAFDSAYFFDITEASGGYNLFRSYYLGGTTFIVSMYPGKNDQATFGVDADRFAVIDVASKSFEWVSGLPTAAGLETDPFLIGMPFIDGESEQLIVPITTSENTHYLYALDPSSASASQLSNVIGEGVKAVGMLKSAD